MLGTVVVVVLLLAAFAIGVPPLVRAAADLRARILGRRPRSHTRRRRTER